MSFLRGILLAFSMFTLIPVPKTEWNEENMRYMMCGLPLIGAVIGVSLFLWSGLSGLLGFGVFLRAAGFTFLPVLITGGIHLDGFCDTMDAVASRAEPARKREILKDPHSGAFAIIGLCAYLLTYYSLCTELTPDLKTLSLLALTHVMTRAGSGLAAVAYPINGEKGLLNTFHHAAYKKPATIILFATLLLCAAGIIAVGGITGIGMCMITVIALRYIFVFSGAQFNGMSGDLSGYYLQITEFTMLAVLVVIPKVVELL